MPSKGKSNHQTMDMEVDDKVEEETKDVDFESDIDSWQIGKEDSSGSSSSSLWFKEAGKSSSKQENIMNKENFNQKLLGETERKHLRCFRKMKNTADIEFPSGLECETNTISSIEDTSNTSFGSVAASRFTAKESLSSEEISILLKDMDKSSESDNEIRRSRLQSIENVASSDVTEPDKNKVMFSMNFSCTFCKTNLQSLEELKLHERKHRNNSTHLMENQIEYKSEFENTSFFDSVKSWTSNRKNKLDNLNTMRDNVTVPNLTTNLKGFRCKLCRHHSSDLLAYKSHQILIHSEKDKLLDCEYCNYHTTLCSNLAKHIAEHFQKCSYPRCDYKYTSKASYDSHILTSHVENGAFKCQKCDYECKTHKKLKRHAQKHVVIGKYTCTDCSLNLGNKAMLRIHLKTHKLSTMQFKCKECDAMFSKKYLFKRHKKDHSQIFTCSKCDNKFCKKDSLTLHMKVHTVQSFKCEECNQVFLKKNHLQLHMRSHRPVLGCKHCSFQTKSSKRFSKHACINKLYDIQERTLNFQQEDESLLQRQTSEILEKIIDSKAKSNKIMAKLTKATKYGRKNKATARKLNSHTELSDGNLKLKSLRQNLPSRRSQVAIKSCESTALHNLGNSTSTVSKPCPRKSRSSCELLSKKESVVNKKPTKIKKRSKKELVTFGSDGAKWVLGKSFTEKELLKEPIQLTNSSFVQCYYQSQSPASPDHIFLHLRQSRLLSCRFCSYKTNSSYLLKRHSANIHAWDPTLINNLFR